MSHFTEQPLRLDFLDYSTNKKHFQLAQELIYHVGHESSEDVVRVPVGYQTDFASVPRIFWSILPPVGRYSRAAVVHDYLCEQCETHHYQYDQCDIKTRKEADYIFLEAMYVLNVKPWKRCVMFYGVRLWGMISEWRGKRRSSKKKAASHLSSI